MNVSLLKRHPLNTILTSIVIADHQTQQILLSYLKKTYKLELDKFQLLPSTTYNYRLPIVEEETQTTINCIAKLIIIDKIKDHHYIHRQFIGSTCILVTNIKNNLTCVVAGNAAQFKAIHLIVTLTNPDEYTEAELKVEDLAEMFPQIESISVVSINNKKDCIAAIDEINQQTFAKRVKLQNQMYQRYLKV